MLLVIVVFILLSVSSLIAISWEASSAFPPIELYWPCRVFSTPLYQNTLTSDKSKANTSTWNGKRGILERFYCLFNRKAANLDFNIYYHGPLVNQIIISSIKRCIPFIILVICYILFTLIFLFTVFSDKSNSSSPQTYHSSIPAHSFLLNQENIAAYKKRLAIEEFNYLLNIKVNCPNYNSNHNLIHQQCYSITHSQQAYSIDNHSEQQYDFLTDQQQAYSIDNHSEQQYDYIIYSQQANSYEKVSPQYLLHSYLLHTLLKSEIPHQSFQGVPCSILYSQYPEISNSVLYLTQYNNHNQLQCDYQASTCNQPITGTIQLPPNNQVIPRPPNDLIDHQTIELLIGAFTKSLHHYIADSKDYSFDHLLSNIPLNYSSRNINQASSNLTVSLLSSNHYMTPSQYMIPFQDIAFSQNIIQSQYMTPSQDALSNGLLIRIIARICPYDHTRILINPQGILSDCTTKFDLNCYAPDPVSCSSPPLYIIPHRDKRGYNNTLGRVQEIPKRMLLIQSLCFKWMSLCRL
jgi:hypothetical protein